MPSLIAYAVRSDCAVVPESDLSPVARAILERMARCAYMIDCHREGIALNSQRIAALQAELALSEGER